MVKEKQEEVLNSQKDNQFPSFGLDFIAPILRNLKNHLFTRLISHSFFWHFILLFIIFLLPLLFHYFDYSILSKDSQNFFENTLILTSYDSYFYAKGVKEFLETFNLSLPYLSILGGILTKIFGLENTLVWSSVILSASFGVVLYFLIFTVLEYLGILTKKTNQIFAFLGAILGVLSPHFYQRNGAGYFDTDMLILSLPLLAVICLWQYLVKRQFYFLVFFSLTTFLSVGWHNGIQNLLLVGFLLYVGYELFNILFFKQAKSPILVISSLFLIVLSPSPYSFFVLLLALIALYFERLKISLVVFCLACGYAYFFGLFNPMIAQLKAYLFGEIQYSKAFIYASVVESILETSKANFAILMQRSGGVGLFFLGLIGFVGFGFYYSLVRKNFIYLCIFLFPFLLLGFATLKLGVRFSFFLSPILALGCVLLVVGFLGIIQRFLKIILLVFAGIVAMWIANLEYEIPKPILKAQEIEAFKALPFGLNDIVFVWWDYGYALEYFTQAQTLLHGGRHSGIVNYPIAEILLNHSEILGKNLSLLLAQKMQEIPKSQWNRIFEIILKQEKETPQAFLRKLALNDFRINCYSKGEVYWILPKRMLFLAANINGFRNIDLESGKRIKEGVFLYEKTNSKTKEEYVLFKDFYLKKIQNGTLDAKLIFKDIQFVMDFDYLKSNLIQWLVFRNNPMMNLVFENESILVYQIPKE